MIRASADQQRLLDEIDARQDDVLEKLAELNHRAESLLEECQAICRNRKTSSEGVGPPRGHATSQRSLPSVEMP